MKKRFEKQEIIDTSLVYIKGGQDNKKKEKAEADNNESATEEIEMVIERLERG